MQIQILDAEKGETVIHIIRARLQPSNKLLAKLRYGENRIMLNGSICRTDAIVSSGDVLFLDLSDHEQTSLIPWDTALDILYEDSDILLVNKPAGMPVHPSPGHHDHHTLANALTGQFGENLVFRPVGRLDIWTSGCMLCAKNKYAAGLYDRKKKDGTLQKYYLALTTGIPQVANGILDTRLKQTENGLQMVEAALNDNKGRDAKTAYRVLYHTDCHALILAQTITGRMHQIRAQFAAIGCPLIGDTAYGGDCKLPRQALHAYAMRIDETVITAPLPNDLCRILETFFHLSGPKTEILLQGAIS